MSLVLIVDSVVKGEAKAGGSRRALLSLLDLSRSGTA